MFIGFKAFRIFHYLTFLRLNSQHLFRSLTVPRQLSTATGTHYQTQRLNTHIHDLTVPEARSPEWASLGLAGKNPGAGRAVFLLEAPGESGLPCPVQILEAAHTPWLVLKASSGRPSSPAASL